jgi:hypothetical protein
MLVFENFKRQSPRTASPGETISPDMNDRDFLHDAHRNLENLCPLHTCVSLRLCVRIVCQIFANAQIRKGGNLTCGPLASSLQLRPTFRIGCVRDVCLFCEPGGNLYGSQRWLCGDRTRLIRLISAATTKPINATTTTERSTVPCGIPSHGMSRQMSWRFGDEKTLTDVGETAGP